MATLIEHGDVLDVRDLAELAREIYADETSEGPERFITAEQRNTQDALRAFLSDLGYTWGVQAGPWETWQEWLPDVLEGMADHEPTLIAEDYWLTYVQQLADDVAPEPGGVFGVIDERYRDAWPYQYVTIDWEAAADALRADYNEVTLDGHSYLIRSV